jgi:hypothetical protein
MPAVLDVWVAKPGSVCQVDDDHWLVRVFDAHGTIFSWFGTTYTDLSAPHAHWAGTIPPGTYVVQAVNANTGVETDHAIVVVDCAGLACVHLYVTAKPGSQKCKIAITGVTGLGEPDPKVIHVVGTASGCPKVEVIVSCATAIKNTAVVPVSASGDWIASISANNLRCRCGKPVTVVAQCADDPKCFDKFQSEALKCTSP